MIPITIRAISEVGAHVAAPDLAAARGGGHAAGDCEACEEELDSHASLSSDRGSNRGSNRNSNITITI